SLPTSPTHSLLSLHAALPISMIGLVRFGPDHWGLFLINPATWIVGTMSLVAFAYTAGLFVCVLRSGAAGEPPCVRWPAGDFSLRSEEHTSELQSRENLVCRLL